MAQPAHRPQTENTDSAFDGFNTTCPHCGATDELYVVSGTFTGKLWLRPDGFSLLEGDVCTDDEILECRVCHKESALEQN